MGRFRPESFKFLIFILALSTARSCFRVGFRPDSGRESLKIGSSAGFDAFSIAGHPMAVWPEFWGPVFGFSILVATVSPLTGPTSPMGRKSCFRVGFRPDSGRESLKIGPSAGFDAFSMAGYPMAPYWRPLGALLGPREANRAGYLKAVWPDFCWVGFWGLGGPWWL